MSQNPPAAAHRRPIFIAPAVNGKPAEPSASNAESSMPYTCITCARRKVRCDKTAPICSTCRKARLDCEYQEPAPRKRKRKPADDAHERLTHYESILKQHGLLTKDEGAPISPAESTPPQPHPAASRGNMNDTSAGKLLTTEGKTRYIDSNIWRHLGEEDFHPSSDEEDDEESEPLWQSGMTSADPMSMALTGPRSPSASLVDLHPTYESAMKLWNIYVENIDPLVKVVHVVSFQPTLQRAAANPSAASATSKATEALMFAIYHFAIIAITEDDCQKLFGSPKSRLATLYHDATRQALVNAGFLRTTDITVLQAYMLFLLSVRNKYDPHTFWILTGIAVRIAQRLGLHRDGEEHGLKPFDVQMRRRIFYQLLPLDGMAAQLCGTGISVSSDSWDTKQPLNVDDRDIWPDMTEPPESHIGATDMIFCRARTELAKFIHKANPAFGNWERMLEHETVAEREIRLKALEEELETRYLRYCDFANPLHNLVSAMSRGAMASARLRIRLPRAKAIRDLPEDERKVVWTLANRVIDYMIAAHNNPGLHKFEWHLQAFFQWDPLIWILHEIRRDPQANASDEVWAKVEQIFHYHPSMLTQKRALHTAVAHLTLRSWDLARSTQPPEELMAKTEPSFVTSIRLLFQRRSSTHDSSSAPTTEEYNPFDPAADQSDDLPVFSNVEWDVSNFDLQGIGNFNTDARDWLFWDQLVHGPNAFPTT